MSSNANESLLSAYLDDEVEATERSEAERWLATSPWARQQLADMAANQADLRALPRYRLPRDFPDRVRRAIRSAEPAARPHWRLAPWVTVAVSMAAVFLLAFLTPARHDPATRSRLAMTRKVPQWIAVCDLAITPAGQASGVVETTLAEAGIEFDADEPGVKLDKALHTSLLTLLDSNFIDGVQRRDAASGDPAPPAAVEMVYLHGTGAQIDQLLRQLNAHPDVHVQMDMVMSARERDVLLNIGGMTWKLAQADARQSPYSRAYRLQLGLELQSGSEALVGRIPSPAVSTSLVPQQDVGDNQASREMQEVLVILRNLRTTPPASQPR